ncbi:hypothetical protein MKW92_034617 [Papaver armeniacum]|nr:hypothetical protein MKW92_034617 [Papaver armeniacum]
MAGKYNQRMTVGATCDKVPRVCVARGSTGPDCCNKKCVDTWNDRNNCGRCAKKCKYSETCCDGYCVNLRFDEYHCGRCNNRCNSRKSSKKKNYKPSSCSYGMCNYA